MFYIFFSKGAINLHKEGIFNGFLHAGVTGSSRGFFSEGPYLLKLVLLLIAGFIAYSIAKTLKIWMTNNASPLQSRVASAVTKRSEVWGGRGHASTNTSYYVTFEFQDGSRMELEVKAKAYGLIVEGDRGELSYKGSRFRGFVRSRQANL
jgi:hypothetical protein